VTSSKSQSRGSSASTSKSLMSTSSPCEILEKLHDNGLLLTKSTISTENKTSTNHLVQNEINLSNQDVKEVTILLAG
jgi:hypothetical protein